MVGLAITMGGHVGTIKDPTTSGSETNCVSLDGVGGRGGVVATESWSTYGVATASNYAPIVFSVAGGPVICVAIHLDRLA